MDADKIRQTLAHHANEILCTRKLFCCRDDNRHEIVVPPDASDNVAQNPLMRVLVVDWNMQFFCNLTHGIREGVVFCTLDMTVLRINNFMTALCKAANNNLPLMGTNGKLHLVPIVPRFFRA